MPRILSDFHQRLGGWPFPDRQTSFRLLRIYLDSDEPMMCPKYTSSALSSLLTHNTVSFSPYRLSAGRRDRADGSV